MKKNPSIEDIEANENDAYDISKMRIDYIGGVRIMLRDVKTVIQSFILMLNALVGFLSFLFFNFIKIFFYIIILWATWYGIILFFPYFMELVVLVAIPVLNILVVLFNIFAMVAIVILRILIMVWNMLVPLLGMILYLIINVFVTVLTQIFNIIGAIDWEPIVSAFMQILMPMVDVSMQIVMALLKVGAETISSLASVVGDLVEILMMFVKVILDIVSWLFQFLYPILEPILQLIGIFFGSFGQMFGSRKLMSASSDFRGGGRVWSSGVGSRKTEPDYWGYVQETLGDDYRRDADSVDKMVAQYFGSKLNREYVDSSVGQHTLFGRKPLAYSRGGLEFVEEEDEDTNLDDIAHTMAHTMYTMSRDIPGDTIDLAKMTMSRIKAHAEDNSAIGIKALLAEYHLKHNHYEVDRSRTLAAVKFGRTPESPQDMSVRLSRERELATMNSGRRMLDTTWDSEKDKYMSDLRVQHARDIIEQEAVYKKYHFDRMRFATVAYSAWTTSMADVFNSGVITPQILAHHTNKAFEKFGYGGVWDVYHDFNNRHGDPATLLVTMSKISEMPLFKFFKTHHPTKPASTFFHDWAAEKLKTGHDEFSYAPGTGRMLFQMAGGGDKNVQSSGDSSESLGGLAVLSTLDCEGDLQNALCIPEIPPDFTLSLPEPKLTKEDEELLLKNVALCRPWKYSLALVDQYTFYNLYQEFRFVLSAFPPINYAVATITVFAPWTGIFLDWMFMVPKFKTLRDFQALCFAYYTYTIFVTAVLAYLIYLLVSYWWPPIKLLIVNFYVSFTARLPPSKSKQRTLKRIERIAKRMQSKSSDAPIGAEMSSTMNIRGEVVHRWDDDSNIVQLLREFIAHHSQRDNSIHNFINFIHHNHYDLSSSIDHENENLVHVQRLLDTDIAHNLLEYNNPDSDEE